jgi:hypothetical protein
MLAQRLVSYQGAVAAGAVPGDVAASQPQEESMPDRYVTPSAEAPPLTQEQLVAMFGSAPMIGQEVGLFSIAKVGDE